MPKNFNNFLQENINLLNLQIDCYNLFILFLKSATALIR